MSPEPNYQSLKDITKASYKTLLPGVLHSFSIIITISSGFLGGLFFIYIYLHYGNTILAALVLAFLILFGVAHALLFDSLACILSRLIRVQNSK